MLRSMLFVPADSERKLAKAEGAGADALILDLEDSVLPQGKVAARESAARFLQSASARTPVWVRVNALLSGEILKDLTAIVPAKPAGVVLPKVCGPEDVQTVVHYLDALEEACGGQRAQIEILTIATETPSAVLRMGAFVGTSLRRLRALSWGAEDLSSAIGAGDPRTPDGAWRPLYEHARNQCILVAHALSLEALDTVFVDFRDTEGLKKSCHASRHDGFTGRLAIHPDQVPIINQAFTPSAVDLAFAQRIVDAFASGSGAVALDGKMYDIPHLKAAQRLLKNRCPVN